MLGNPCVFLMHMNSFSRALGLGARLTPERNVPPLWGLGGVSQRTSLDSFLRLVGEPVSI